MTSAIETTGLARAFGRLEAVRGLDLQVPAGSIFALIGPNGAGKTTTIKLLMNLVRPTRGSARILGVDSRRLGVAEFQRIGTRRTATRTPRRGTTPAWNQATGTEPVISVAEAWRSGTQAEQLAVL